MNLPHVRESATSLLFEKQKQKQKQKQKNKTKQNKTKQNTNKQTKKGSNCNTFVNGFTVITYWSHLILFHWALPGKKQASFRRHTKNVNEAKPISLSVRKCIS